MKESIAAQNWEKITVNHVYHSFLKGEFAKCIETFGQHNVINRELIDRPNFDNESQNCHRVMLLSFRALLLLRIPCSTVWYKVTSLNEFHLNELIVIGRCGWDDVYRIDKNELFAVAKRKSEILASSPSEWESPILWGHTKDGPFTIIEGNHRFVALASLENKIKFQIPCYIGLSPDSCVFHFPDS